MPGLMHVRRVLLKPAATAAAAGTSTITYRNQTFDITNQGNSVPYTFSGLNIGTSTEDLIIGVVGRQTTTQTITSITVNGVAATHRATNGPGGGNTAAIYTFPADGDSTPDIVVTWGGDVLRCGIAVWTITGHSSLVPTDTDTSVADPGSLTLTVPTNGSAVGLVCGNGNSTWTWTGLTEAVLGFDQAIESGFNFSGAALNGSGDIAITADGSAAESALRLVAAAWGP
jgi:hypothetical protein